jgi:hypothetical protein
MWWGNNPELLFPPRVLQVVADLQRIISSIDLDKVESFSDRTPACLDYLDPFLAEFPDVDHTWASLKADTAGVGTMTLEVNGSTTISLWLRSAGEGPFATGGIVFAASTWKSQRNYHVNRAIRDALLLVERVLAGSGTRLRGGVDGGPPRVWSAGQWVQFSDDRMPVMVPWGRALASGS